MFNIKREIGSFQLAYGALFDKNLYVSVVLAAILKRSLIITTGDLTACTVQLQHLLAECVGLDFRRVEMARGDTKEKVLGKFTAGCTGNHLRSVYVVSRVELLPEELQGWLSEVLGGASITCEGQVYFKSEIFMVILVRDGAGEASSDSGTLSWRLKRFFLFEQPHSSTYGVNGNSLLDVSEASDSSKTRNLLDLSNSINKIVIVPEVSRYIYDIIVFARTHRAVDTGVPTSTIKEMELYSKGICVLFNRNFVIPSIVKLSARRLLPFKIRIISKDNEPSLQWGSDPDIVDAFIRRVTPELVIEDVLSKVMPPV